MVVKVALGVAAGLLLFSLATGWAAEMGVRWRCQQQGREYVWDARFGHTCMP